MPLAGETQPLSCELQVTTPTESCFDGTSTGSVGPWKSAGDAVRAACSSAEVFPPSPLEASPPPESLEPPPQPATRAVRDSPVSRVAAMRRPAPVWDLLDN